MKNKTKPVLMALLLAFSVYAQAQKPRGDRTLAWQVDLPQSQLYDSSFRYAHQACMEVVHLFYPWNAIEPTGGNFDATFMAQNLDVANVYYPIAGTRVEMQLAPVNAHQKMVPADLALVDFDDTLMINRFKEFLDTLFNHIPNLKLAALNIGNESTGYLKGNPNAYAAFKVFLDSVVPYAKQKYQDLHGNTLKVGSTFTFHGLTSPGTSALCKSVNANLDHVSVTYYPLNGDFTMKDPPVVMGDFGTLVKEYPATPIYFAECGYASSAFCNSSEAKQALFYTEVFKAWDSFSTHISTITIFKSNDWSRQEVNGLAAFYGISDTVFKEYLRTLGVRNWEGNGSNKQAYEQILCELDNRSWCVTSKCGLTHTPILKGPNRIKVYPNPCSGKLNIKGTPDISSFQLLNLQGEMLLQGPLLGPIDMSRFAKGFYVLRLKSHTETFSFSVIRAVN